MPSFVRKLVIFATIDSLILQAHGHSESPKAISIDFKSKRIKEVHKEAIQPSDKAARLESHGVIGQITVATSSFLIAITQREQVAQIFGKPIYAITDVALLPLSTREDVNRAILSANSSDSADFDTSDTDTSDSEDEQSNVTTADVACSPSEHESPFKQQNRSNTSIAEDVATRKITFGHFASQWLSKRGSISTAGRKAASGPEESQTESPPPTSSRPAQATSSVAMDGDDPSSPPEHEPEQSVSSDIASSSAALGLLPKILRTTKMIFSSRSYYFAYDYDLTWRLSARAESKLPLSCKSLNPLFFWNRKMGSNFIDSGHEAFLTPIIQGFVGQRTFKLSSQGRRSSTVAVEPLKTDSGLERSARTGDLSEGTFLLTLISRRSVKRSGLRYLRRGIDDEGNCANFVESEQVLSSPLWEPQNRIRSFVQIRGSIPLYFSQSPYSFKPVAVVHNSPQANEAAFSKHFQDLKRQYVHIQIAALVDKHGPELSIGNAYEKLYKQTTESGRLSQVAFEWFDFHRECRGMKFENVHHLVDKFRQDLNTWGETVVRNGIVEATQTGTIRTNCMDCLDRTNVAQSAFAQYRLQKDLEDEGYEIDLVHDESTNWFNTLWADNGDAISRLYAGTAALKGDYTRTRKRNWRGAINDLGLTLSRYYSNMVNDYFSQAVIDLLLNNISWRVFEDFESTMVSADPGISVQTAREATVEKCAKIVIQGSKEDLVHGWTMSAPAQENTLRTLPFEEVVVLLTDAALYCCKLDWMTEKVARFEKINLRSISKIRHGTYVTSTFTENQMDEKLNQGILIVYTPGKGDLIRVNTRSLQNEVEESAHSSSIDGGTGILSWLAPGPSPSQDKVMALKAVPTSAEHSSASSATKDQTPRQLVESISEEINRAIVGQGEQNDHLLEAGNIISAAEAKQRTGYLEQLGHSIKRFVWV